MNNYDLLESVDDYDLAHQYRIVSYLTNLYELSCSMQCLNKNKNAFIDENWSKLVKIIDMNVGDEVCIILNNPDYTFIPKIKPYSICLLTISNIKSRKVWRHSNIIHIKNGIMYRFEPHGSCVDI